MVLTNPVQPNEESFLRIHAPSSLGIIVNEDERHWTAVRWEHDSYWLLDSLKPNAMPMTLTDAITYIERYRHAFLIVDHMYDRM